ncbi:hypothetical protein PRZ48_000176 [Zasmidium cellare]|uniref:Uncharacterized protein n=1 Tax=Zasmidium cellare TaxID=395010 RepID=A0ABR0EYI4_ZASCE|nr:hypothetical protein PRZ48_000176 [Zasmidium cellare]
MGRTKFHDLQAELKKTKTEFEALKREKEGCRVAVSEGLGLGDHITVLSVGHNFESIYLHTGLIPVQVQRWIAGHGLVNGLLYPLIEESADMLRLYRLFLYSGKIGSKDEDIVRPSPDSSAHDDEAEEAKDSEWHQLVLMYHFGSKIRDEKFVNKVLDALVEKVQEEDRWPTDLAWDVYDETKVGDALRRLYVDLHVWVGQGSGVNYPYEDRDGPEQFRRDVKVGMIMAGEKVHDPEVEMPWQTQFCALYHTHFVTPVCGTASAEVIDLSQD